ncbi:MAG: hypothetical protein NTU73_05655, partial [Ignavibacteriae bacterium]|nr:hypothetical protein [Ignavibacteriota bacterium]
MLKKLLLLSFALVFVANFVNATPRLSQSALMKYVNAEVKVKLVGDALIGYTVSNKKVFDINKIGGGLKDAPLWGMNVSIKYTGAFSIYDMQSNGTATECIQDPNNAARIHFVQMWSPAGDPNPGYTGRLTKYYYSTNTGTNFSFVSNVPSVRSGYCAITLMTNGNALIGNHNAGTTVVNQAHFYYDAAPGLGSFTELYSGAFLDYIWPRMVATNSLTAPNKFIYVASPNGRDSCFWSNCTSINPSPGTFGPWNFFYGDQAETYSLARGTDGRIGIAYNVNSALLVADYGDVFFIESTNGGTSFSTPLKIFDADISPSGDSLGMLRGLQMVYQGNDAKVVFETIKQTTAGTFYPGGIARIRFWSPTLPGSDPNKSIVIADTNMIGWWPYISGGATSDVLASLCRPTIGRSVTGNYLYCAFMTPMGEYGVGGPNIFVGGSVDTNAFNRVWLTYSSNNGANWVIPQQITPWNVASPLDWTYPSISPTSDVVGTNFYVNMTIQSDSIPGSHVNHSVNGESFAKFNFVRVNVTPVGINGISSEVPNSYSLKQNYPNPF